MRAMPSEDVLVMESLGLGFPLDFFEPICFFCINIFASLELDVVVCEFLYIRLFVDFRFGGMDGNFGTKSVNQ